MIGQPDLDIALLRNFVAVAEAGGFTAAGEVLGASQSAVSVRLRKLEERIGRRLMERDARQVALTAAGQAFLEDARQVLRTHDTALRRAIGRGPRRSYEIGISDHAAGGLLPGLLAGLREALPEVTLQVQVGHSAGLFAEFAAGRFDAVVGRVDLPLPSDRLLIEDRLIWAVAAGAEPSGEGPLPLVTLDLPCALRGIALAALAAAGRDWRPVFTASGVAAVQAAVAAGLGLACLERRNLPPGCVEAVAGLPALPATKVVLRSRAGGRPGRAVAEAVAAAFDGLAAQARSSFEESITT